MKKLSDDTKETLKEIDEVFTVIGVIIAIGTIILMMIIGFFFIVIIRQLNVVYSIHEIRFFLG